MLASVSMWLLANVRQLGFHTSLEEVQLAEIVNNIECCFVFDDALSIL